MKGFVRSFFCNRLHIAWGRRAWELKGIKDGAVVNYSGDPFLTRAEAKAALPLWRRFDLLYDEVIAQNVETGEVLA